MPAARVAPPVTLPAEFGRLVRERPGWLYGMAASMGLGLATFLFAIFFTRHHPHRDPTTALVLPALLTAIADGCLTNQIAAEPERLGMWLRPGADPVRLMRVRNQVLLLAESAFVAVLVLLTVLLTKRSTGWVVNDLPKLVVLPIVPVAMGNILSVVLPCPFMPLSRRLQAPETWARWAGYIAVPFGLSAIAGAVIAVPWFLEGHLFRSHALAAGHVDGLWVGVWLVATPLWNWGVWRISLEVAGRLVRKRGNTLIRLAREHAALEQRLDDRSLVAAVVRVPGALRRAHMQRRDIAGERMLGRDRAN